MKKKARVESPPQSPLAPSDQLEPCSPDPDESAMEQEEEEEEEMVEISDEEQEGISGANRTEPQLEDSFDLLNETPQTQTQETIDDTLQKRRW